MPGSGSIASPRPPPPPPPPTAVPSSRIGVGPQERGGDERGESEYEGDYDTDIASSAKHKDALKAHARDPSLEDSITADETSLSSPALTRPPQMPPSAPGHRAVPPPPPQSAAPKPSRQSTDLPRAPPPIPPSRDVPGSRGDDDYDPYSYVDTARSPPPLPAVGAPPVPPREPEPEQGESSDDMYDAPPTRKSTDRPPPPPPGQPAPQDRVPPMPPTQQAPLPIRSAPRQSHDAPRGPPSGRRSLEQVGRPSGEHGQIATDVDLNEATQWWTAARPLPPALQSRNGVDLLSECEESTTSKRGGRTTVSKDVYVLYMDYSQTVVTARYDAAAPGDVSLEQRHEPPPGKLRQDQLEAYWHRFGAGLAESASALGGAGKKDAAAAAAANVGDGSTAALVLELVRRLPEALLPVGTRAYGAPVYANLANASVMQFDEIRAGDVVTLRNAKFEGKHSGPMHQKYRQETGPAHVALVHEWDGTKKKIRAWEQQQQQGGGGVGGSGGGGSGSSKDKKGGGLKLESFRLGDLKSGEVRVWRVVGREWVGWDSNA